MLDNASRVTARVNTSQCIQQSHPDIVACHNNQDNRNEDRSLFCDGSLIRQGTERKCNVNRKNRNDNLLYNLQNDLLELV